MADRWTDTTVEAPVNELVMALEVTIGAPATIGDSDHGFRRFIPITGGRFTGAGIHGDVVPGGADWQLTRPDGVVEIHAIYALRTDDGQLISVDNRGIIAPAEDAAATARYVRATPRFHAPTGPYEWLNRRLFTATITPSPNRDRVTVRVFQIN